MKKIQPCYSSLSDMKSATRKIIFLFFLKSLLHTRYIFQGLQKTGLHNTMFLEWGHYHFSSAYVTLSFYILFLFHCQSIHKTGSESVRGGPQISSQGGEFPHGDREVGMSSSRESPLSSHILGTKES